MSDTTVKKVSSATSPKGEMGQVYLASGKHVAMRLWQNEPARPTSPPQARLRDRRLRHRRQGRAHAGGADTAARARRRVAGAGWGRARLPHHRAVHRGRGDRPAGPSPRAGRGLARRGPGACWHPPPGRSRRYPALLDPVPDDASAREILLRPDVRVPTRRARGRDDRHGGRTAGIRRGLYHVPIDAWVDRDDHTLGAFQLLAQRGVRAPWKSAR